MSAKITNMTEGKPLPLLLHFSMSLMIGNIFQQLYTVVDTMVVGKGLGVNALAALGASDWMNWMMLGTVQGFTQGFGILMAQEFGANRFDRLRKVVGNSFSLSLFISVILLVLGQLIAKPVLLLLHTPAEILPDSLIYLRLIFFGIPIIMLYNYFACVLRSLGDSKTPLYAMIVAALCNIVLDCLFVLVFHMGIPGAAIATLIAQVISSIFCYLQIRKITFIKLERSSFTPELSLDKKLISLGLPMAFQNAIISVGGMIVQSVVNGFGVIFIAGFTATNKLYGILEIAAISYGYSMITYVGQNIGAGKTDRIKKGMRTAVILSLITSVIIALIMIVFGKQILSLFISGTPDVYEKTMEIAYLYLFIMSICLPILYILHITRSAIQGMGNTFLPMLSGIAEFIMRTGSALALPLFVGQIGIFFAEVLAWLGADLILVVSYLIVSKKIFAQIDNHDLAS